MALFAYASKVKMIHFYPGMGATSEMYAESWRELPDSVFHVWPEWKGELTIAELASNLKEEHGIKRGDIVVGSSLGAMVACELSNQIELARIILIGGAKNKEEVSRLLSVLMPLIDLAPMDFIRISAGKVPHELSTMYAGCDPEFIRNMCKAIFTWDGLQSEVEVSRIHGSNDYVIPLPDQVDKVIKGGHLIAMTHAEECLEQIVEDVGVLPH